MNKSTAFLLIIIVLATIAGVASWRFLSHARAAADGIAAVGRSSSERVISDATDTGSLPIPIGAVAASETPSGTIFAGPVQPSADGGGAGVFTKDIKDSKDSKDPNGFADSVSVNSSPAAMSMNGAMISFNFDDGWLSAYENAFPIFNAAGFKTTQYIITGALGEKNYITKEDVLAMQAEGHEIGAHTRTHPHLTQLSAADAQNEIEGSKQDLLAMGIRSVTTFAYPYGDANPAVEKAVKDDGFAGARITKPEYDDSSVDPFLLKRQGVEAGTTFAEIKSAIDTAIADKKWIILVFHGIDDGRPESTTHEMVQQIVDYVKQVKIPVVTTAEGLKVMGKIN